MHLENIMVKPTSLEDKQRQLMDVLIMCGNGWHSRARIATQLGKNRLNPTEVTLLEVLASAGKIEKALHPTDLPQNNQWVYRIKQD